MEDEGLLSVRCGSQSPLLLGATHPLGQSTQSRQRSWSREEKIELMLCYYAARRDGRGYRHPLKELWDTRNPSKCFRSENNLCCQAHAVINSTVFTARELAEIERRSGSMGNDFAKPCNNQS